jgi:hypothetical protein
MVVKSLHAAVLSCRRFPAAAAGAAASCFQARSHPGLAQLQLSGMKFVSHKCDDTRLIIFV